MPCFGLRENSSPTPIEIVVAEFELTIIGLDVFFPTNDFHEESDTDFGEAPLLGLSSPAVANGVVYVGSTDGKVYAFGLK
jgi:hypothetical protein